MPSLANQTSKHGKRQRPGKPARAWSHDNAIGADVVLDAGEVNDMTALPQRALSEEARREMVATAAYYISEKRGFNSGDELADWLAAEEEIAAMLGKIDR